MVKKLVFSAVKDHVIIKKVIELLRKENEISLKLHDPTEDFLEHLGIYPGLPQQKFMHRGVTHRLDDNIYRQMIVDAGSKAKAILDKQVATHEWQRALGNPDMHVALRKQVEEIIGSEYASAKEKAKYEQMQKGLK